MPIQDRLPKIQLKAAYLNLIQSVENNLTIILVQEWRFFVKSEQSYVSSFSYKVRFPFKFN